MSTSPAGDRPTRRTNAAVIAAAWAVVTVPLAWGVSQTVVKSLPLFHATPPAATTAPAAPAAR